MLIRRYILQILICLGTVLTGCKQTEPDIFNSIVEDHNAAPETTTLVIKRLSDKKVWINNMERAQTRHIPASTSKIPHTLIALETKVAVPDTLFKWDEQERTFKSWNQDQTLTQAFQRSAVWVYQDIVGGLGFEAMTSWLTQFNYGNRAIGSPENITRFWLTGPLKISALEQVNFLIQLAKKNLPLSPETYEMAWPIFINETSNSHTLYAKTGWMYDEAAMDIGWFVGWVEAHAQSEIYVFALNMDMPEQDDQKKRKPIVMEALKHVGAWPD